MSWAKSPTGVVHDRNLVKLWVYRCERCANHMLATMQPSRCSSCRKRHARLHLVGHVLMEQTAPPREPYSDRPPFELRRL